MGKPKIIPAMDIGKIAKVSGLPPSTLRYYEEKGLIQSTGRHGLRRLFHVQTVERLEFIALGRRAGFSLQELSEMLGADGAFRVDRKLLLMKATELRTSIKQLIATQNLLEHVAHCPRPNQFDCPKFQRLLRVAGMTQRRTRGGK